MSDDIRSSATFLSTSTPIGKQLKKPTPKLSMICHRGNEKENIFDESGKSDSSNERSRSKLEMSQSSSDNSPIFKGRSNQSLRERLMRHEHKKSKIPLSNRQLHVNRIDSSSDNSKSEDVLMDTVRSFASLNFSDKIKPPDRSIIYDSPPIFNNSRKLQRVLLDNTNSSSANANSFNDKNESDDEDSHVSIVPESPLGSPTKNCHTDKSSDSGSFVSAKDTSPTSDNEKKNDDPSIVALTPVVKPKTIMTQTQITKFVVSRPATFFPPINTARPSITAPSLNWPTFSQVPERGPQIIPPHSLIKPKPSTSNNQRMFTSKTVTNDAIEALHKSLASMPDESIRAKTPDGLRVQLMPHQQHGLTWMLWREQQKPPCGILADDMGLGKTIAVISLILQKKNDRINKIVSEEEQKIRETYAQSKQFIPSYASLIVAPASVIMQWEKEIKDRVGGRLTYHVAHGNNRERFAKNLAKYDIVLTTYGTLTADLNPDTITDSPFANIAWERVILDEAHKIKNRNAKVSRVVANLPGLYRWCLTGTPIHNELWDLFSLVRFMKVAPFHKEVHWKLYIHGGGTQNSKRLNTLVKSMLLRRTKAQVDAVTQKRLIELPPRNYSVVKLEMKGVEHACYQQMFAVSRQRVHQFIRDGMGSTSSRLSKKDGLPTKNPFVFGQREINPGERFKAMNFILVLLLRLRQACVHMCLTRQAIDIDAFKQDAEEGNLETSVVQELERSFADLKVNAIEENNEYNIQIEKLFEQSHKTAKIKAVLSHLFRVIDKREKSVVVSQWTSVLELLEPHLRARRVEYTTINGKIPPRERQNRIDDFNRTNGGAEVMLLSLLAGGVGLNLVGGNHLFIVDLHWNPAMENQACDRIYRVGQTKDVFIHKFVIEQTIEQRVMDLQEKKQTLANTVLEGAADKNLTKLTVNDLKFLFELETRPRK